MNKKYRSKISRANHEWMEAVYSAGGITKAEMYDWDEACIVPQAVPDVRAKREYKTGNKPIASHAREPYSHIVMSAAPPL